MSDILFDILETKEWPELSVKLCEFLKSVPGAEAEALGLDALKVLFHSMVYALPGDLAEKIQTRKNRFIKFKTSSYDPRAMFVALVLINELEAIKKYAGLLESAEINTKVKKAFDPLMAQYAKLPNIRFFTIWTNRFLRHLAPLEAFSKLEHLSLIRCLKLSDISTLSGLKNLRKIKFTQPEALIDASQFNRIENLEALEFDHKAAEMKFEALNPAGVKELKLRMVKMENLKPISHLRLERLVLDQLSTISSLAELKEMQSLQELSLKWLANVKDLSAIGTLENLTVLRMRTPAALDNPTQDLSFLEGMNQLKDLTLTHLELKELDFIKGMNKLEYLTLQNIDIDPGKWSRLSGHLAHIKELTLPAGIPEDIKAGIKRENAAVEFH